MSKRYALLSLLLVILFGGQELFAQQLYTFSKVREHAFIFNPAITGTHNDLQFNMGMRKQWFKVDDSPFTGVVSASGNFDGKAFGLGGYIIHDQTGPTSQTGLGVSGAYHIFLERRYHNVKNMRGQYGKVLSFGLNLSMHQYRVNAEKINFRDGNDIVASNTNNKQMYPDASFGVYYQSKKFYAGFSIPQILGLENNKTDIKKKQHYNVYGGYLIHAKPGKLTIEPTVWLKATSGAPPQADFMLRFWLFETGYVGMNYRTLNTLVFEGGITIKDVLTIGYAYDFEFDEYRSLQGQNHELYLGVRINKNNEPNSRFRYNEDNLRVNQNNEVVQKKSKDSKKVAKPAKESTSKVKEAKPAKAPSSKEDKVKPAKPAKSGKKEPMGFEDF